MYATIAGQSVSIHDGVPSLKDMQDAVGGWITTALRMASPERADVSVDVYCNDEGLLMSLPIHWARSTDLSPLAGGLIVTAADENTGDTIAATEAEIKAVLEHLIPVIPAVTEYTI